MSSVTVRAQVRLKIDELFVQWMNEESTLESLSKLAISIQSSQPLDKPIKTAGEPSTGRDALNISRKNSPPPRGPSPSSPLVSPRSSPKLQRIPLSTPSTPSTPSIELNLEQGKSLVERTAWHQPHKAATISQGPGLNQQHTAINNGSQSSSIPQFHFPNGRPAADNSVKVKLADIRAIFESDGSSQGLEKHQFARLCSVCMVPVYWKGILFRAAGGSGTRTHVKFSSFSQVWKRLTKQYHDSAARFIRLSTRFQRDHLVYHDLFPLVQCIVDDHPGLGFLRESSDFISCYISTVVSRIFYTVNRSWSGRITAAELRRSTLLSAIDNLERMASVNEELSFFSYEHYYVIYCKFSEMNNHARKLDVNDLSEYDEYGLTPAILRRVLSKAVLRYSKKDEMLYSDFVCFMLAEEDKTTATSIEYWFRCLDLDGDGVISMFEMEYFYNEQLDRMQRAGMEPFSFNDCLCQLLDMVKPRKPGCITLHDLKACGNAKIFFNSLFNFTKFVAHEQRDLFSKDGAGDQETVSDWVRFAKLEYACMIAGESDDAKQYDMDEYDGDEEDPQLMALASGNDEE